MLPSIHILYFTALTMWAHTQRFLQPFLSIHTQILAFISNAFLLPSLLFGFGWRKGVKPQYHISHIIIIPEGSWSCPGSWSSPLHRHHHHYCYRGKNSERNLFTRTIQSGLKIRLIIINQQQNTHLSCNPLLDRDNDNSLTKFPFFSDPRSVLKKL